MKGNIKSGEIYKDNDRWLIKYLENGDEKDILVNKNDIELDESIKEGSIVEFEIVEVNTEYPSYKFAIINHKGYNIEMYSKIESLIIKWSTDNNKTAGSLTREIIKIIKKDK